ncbi:restriction endonuclease [Pseudomonas viridiflava]|uniref:restriction endonuclease n=1 Tax=Pseudomonas viridiflava TaxID=33069 RepID=UPI002158D254|nr:restriction endonuclease [Pseudomonas viridiflava]
MINSRVGGSGEIQMVAQRSEETDPSVTSAHPNAVTPSSNPALLSGQMGQRLEPSLESHAAHMGVALRHTELLATFQVQQASIRQTSGRKVSEHAALLIGGMLEQANGHASENAKVGFEVMAGRLCGPRFALESFQSSDVKSLLEKLTNKDDVPDKDEVGQVLKGHAGAIADQLEHFQLMHNASSVHLGECSARDRKTFEVSQAALGEYAGRASKAISSVLSEKSTDLDKRLADLDKQLKGMADGEEKSALLIHKETLGEAKAMLAGIQSDFSKSPQAKHLKSVAAHAQFDTQLKELNEDRAGIGFLQGAGRMTAAAIPQFLSSMTHLGFIRSATNDEFRAAVPGSSSDASMLEATVIGLVAGIAHEGVTNLVKPMLQSGLQVSGLDKRLGMAPLRGVDTESVIPDPLEYKSQDGVMVKKSDEELAAEKAQVKAQRAVFEQKKVQVSSTHPLGEMIPYMSFGGGQAIRQLLHDFHQINGQTVTARALTSGMAGAVSASAQALYQMKATYTDPQGRNIPVFTTDKSISELGKDLAKGLDPRDAAVRTSFYSKAVSGIQSVALTAELPAVAQAGIKGGLSAGRIVGNMALAALGSVSYLSTLYANQSVTAEAKALKAAGEGGATPILERTETAFTNIRRPNRDSLPHTFSPDQLAGLPRMAENTYHRARGVLQVPSQVAVDVLRTVDDGVRSSLSSLQDKLKSQFQRQTVATPRPDEEAVESPVVTEPVVPPDTQLRPTTVSVERPTSVAMDDETLRALEEGLLPQATPQPQRAPQQSVPVTPSYAPTLEAMEEGLLKPDQSTIPSR